MATLRHPRTAALLGFTVACLVAVTGAQGAPPPNDDFANAASLSGDSGAVSLSMSEATVEIAEPNTTGSDPVTRSVWYRWTAAAAGEVTFNTSFPSAGAQRPGPSATFTLANGDVATLSIFITGSGDVPFDPASHRLHLRFKTSDGVTRGSTSVAVRTQ